jgi:hypothetical protein
VDSTAALRIARAKAKKAEIARVINCFIVLLGALGVLGGSIY